MQCLLTCIGSAVNVMFFFKPGIGVVFFFENLINIYYVEYVIGSMFNVQFCSVNTGSISLIKKRTKTFRTEVKGHVVHSKFMVTIEVEKVKQWVKRPFSFPSSD